MAQEQYRKQLRTQGSDYPSQGEMVASSGLGSLCSLRFQVTVDGGHANAQHLCDLSDRVFLRGVEPASRIDLLGIHHGGATANPASCPGSGQASLSPFSDQIPFEFRQRTHDAEEEPPLAVVVSMLSVSERKPTPLSSKSLDKFDEVPEGTTETIEPPHDDDVASRSWSIMRSSSGRLALLPEAWSVNTRRHPPFFSASSCKSALWSSVLTLAYPICVCPMEQTINTRYTPQV